MMNKEQRTYLGLRPIFIKRFMRGSVECLPFLGKLLEEVIFGVLDNESAKAESEKIRSKLNQILQGQDHQEVDFADILLALHVQTDVNGEIRGRLQKIEQSLRDDSDKAFPKYFGKAIEKVFAGNEEILSGIKILSDEHGQQSLEHKQQAKDNEQIHAKLDKLLAKSNVDEKTKKAIEKVFSAILKQENIPEWQWPEKLQEITRRHQELLEKWQRIQSGDPTVDTLRDEARQMIERGDYDGADQVLQKAVDIDRKAIKSQQERLDERKVSMSQSLASRAELAQTKLDHKKAIDLYKEALDILPQNRQTSLATYLNNLGALYYAIANYKEVELLYKRALAIWEAALGKDHPNVATDLNNLAELYRATNRLVEAEPLMKRMVKILENPGGEPLPNYAVALNNLALLYKATNRLGEAEPLYKRALAILERSLGAEHPNSKMVRGNLEGLMGLG